MEKIIMFPKGVEHGIQLSKKQETYGYFTIEKVL